MSFGDNPFNVQGPPTFANCPGDRTFANWVHPAELPISAFRPSFVSANTVSDIPTFGEYKINLSERLDKLEKKHEEIHEILGQVMSLLDAQSKQMNSILDLMGYTPGGEGYEKTKEHYVALETL